MLLLTHSVALCQPFKKSVGKEMTLFCVIFRSECFMVQILFVSLLLFALPCSFSAAFATCCNCATPACPPPFSRTPPPPPRYTSLLFRFPSAFQSALIHFFAGIRYSWVSACGQNGSGCQLHRVRRSGG